MSISRRALGAGLLALVAAACADRAPEHTLATHSAAMLDEARLSASDEALVAQLRARVAKYGSFTAAEADGYGKQITGCLELPPLGGMGFHFADTLKVDTLVRALEPEALLYAPGPNDTKRFVAVEYLVPIQAWTFPQAPQLFGQTFFKNDAVGFYTLHVWTEQNNASGVFADWNPKIHCPT